MNEDNERDMWDAIAANDRPTKTKPALVRVHGNDYLARIDGTSHYADPDDERTYCGDRTGRLLLGVCPWDIEPNCPTCNMAYKMRNA